MYSIYEKIREQIETVVKDAILRSISKGLLPEIELPPIMMEKPREEAFGDFQQILPCRWQSRPKAPGQIAQIIIDRMKTDGTFVVRVEAAARGL